MGLVISREVKQSTATVKSLHLLPFACREAQSLVVPASGIVPEVVSVRDYGGHTFLYRHFPLPLAAFLHATVPLRERSRPPGARMAAQSRASLFPQTTQPACRPWPASQAAVPETTVFNTVALFALVP